MFSRILLPPDYPLPPGATPEQMRKREEAREARRAADRRHMAALLTVAFITLAACAAALVALFVAVTYRFGLVIPAGAVFCGLAVSLLYVKIERWLKRGESE